MLFADYNSVVSFDKQGNIMSSRIYKDTKFILPRICCNDGFSISFQCSATHYCSHNGEYQTLGDTITSVEFGFPSEDDVLLNSYGVDNDDNIHTVGSISIETAQELVDKHGGVNWEKTVSVEAFNKNVKWQEK